MKISGSDLQHLFNPATPNRPESADETRKADASSPSASASSRSASSEATLQGISASVATDTVTPSGGSSVESAGAPSGGAKLSATVRSSRAGYAAGPGFTPFHRELAQALPALWAKARQQNLSRTEQRKKLRTLIAWLASKKGFESQELAPMRYRASGQLVDGKVDLLLRAASGPVLVVEADWTLQEASLGKLKAAHDQGTPVMWVLGTPAKTLADAKEARRFALRTLGKDAPGWLVIFHLEYGWL